MDELLLTIHGIHNSGDWQLQVAEVLEPHFRCHALRYRGYRYFGAVVLLARAVLPLLVIALLLLPFTRNLNAAAWLSLLLLLGMSLVIGWLLPKLTTKNIRKQITDAKRPYLTPPHLIAHSMGTYLCGWALHYYEPVRFGRIILVGSVLPPAFPWEANKASYSNVRNEVGLRDWVVHLVRMLRFVLPGFGASGVSGFIGKPELIHTQTGSWEPCSACRSTSEAASAPIHNVHHQGDHWIDLMTSGNPEDIWLPYLWGYEPGEYAEYLEMCAEIRRALDDAHHAAAGAAQRIFREQIWTWTHGKRCDQFLTELLTVHFKERGELPPAGELNRTVTRIIYDISIAVFVAKAESAKPRGERSEKVIRYLRPGWLFEEKVRSTVNRSAS